MKSIHTSNILFLGGGTMGQAIIESLPEKNLITVIESNEMSRQRLSTMRDISVIESVSDISITPKIVVIAVKPQDAVIALKPLAPVLPESTILISIMAGISITSLRNNAAHEGAIVRAMPNMPSQVTWSATALYEERLAINDRPIISALFGYIGKYWWFENEGDLHAVTAIAGSGPAYLFSFFKVWESTAISLGIPATIAREMIAQTIQGSLVLASKNQEVDIWDLLIKKVASKGGTTEAALESFARNKFKDIVEIAIKEAYQRSKTLD